MRILGFDLGTPTSKTAASLLDTETAEWRHRMVPTRAADLISLVDELKPQRVVMEATQSTGWVVDVLRALNVEIQVVNPRDPAWLNRIAKNDREDARLLVILSLNGQVRTVWVPSARVRDWRSMIAYRQKLVAACTQVKNSIKAILRRRGLSVPQTWNEDGMSVLRLLARPGDLWRDQLGMELRRLADAEKHLEELTDQLDSIGKSDQRVRLLMKQDGVGPRTAEAVVAFIDDPHRFTSGRQVGAYVGLVARVHQSGKTNHTGGITHAGNPVLRTLLIEITWLAIRRDTWMRDCYERIRRGDCKRRHIAVTAVARKLLIRLWATLRDGVAQPPPRQTAMTA